MGEENMYMENLDEFVNDENKIVTYKWLSRTLSVHVNLAKQMLYSFVQQQRNEKNKDALSVTYCLSGFEEKEGQLVHKVMVVPEEKLEASKSNFKSLTSCHMYSVHKNQLKDTNSLYNSDYDVLKKDINNSNKFSGVKCTAAKLLMKEEQREVVADVKTYPEKEKAVTKSSSVSKNKTTVAAMFGNANKNKGTVSNGSSKNTKESQQPKGNKGQIATMFASQSTKPKVEKKKEDEVKPEIKKKILVDQKKDIKSSNRRKHEKAASDDESTHGNEKKRRRIAQKVWDSSSEEEEEPEPEEMLPEEPLPREPTPPRETIENPSPEKIKRENSPHQPQEKRKKNRRRKLVPKHSVDEDGFMVTEKVWESESGTDMSEAEEQKSSKVEEQKSEKNEVTEKPTKKKSPVSKSKHKPKQQSIMGFFTKK